MMSADPSGVVRTIFADSIRAHERFLTDRVDRVVAAAEAMAARWL